MKNTFLAAFLLAALLGPSIVSAACDDVYSFITQADDLGCSSLSLLSADLPNYPYGSTEITFAATIEVANCPNTDPQFSSTLLLINNGNGPLLAVSIQPSGVEISILDPIGDPLTIVSIGQTAGFARFRFVAAIDFTNSKAELLIADSTEIISNDDSSVETGYLVVKASPGPQISFNINNERNLQVADFVVVGKFLGGLDSYRLLFETPNTAGQIASYAMTEGFGWVLRTPGTFGNAYFGESTDSSYQPEFSPVWQNGALTFTNTDQYIRLPPNPLATSSSSSIPYVTSSFAVSFEIFFDSSIPNDGQIFYRQSSNSQNVYSITHNSDLQIFSIMSGETVTFSLSDVPVSQWSQVVVYFAYAQNRLISGTNISDSPSTLNSVTTDTVIEESPTDILKIGGFIGSIRNFKIFSPASPAFNDPSSCITNCISDLGLRSTQCVTCSPNYFVDGPGCSLCDTTCASCDGATANSCRSCNPPQTLNSNYACSCPSGTYPQGSGCPNCPTDCSLCTSATAGCQFCQQNCGVSCPPNTYLVGKKCFDCPHNCKSCTTASSKCAFCKRCPPKQCSISKAKAKMDL